MSDAQKVLFRFGSKEDYRKITPDESTLYFLQDSKELYRGQNLIASSDASFVDDVPEYDEAQPNILYIVLNADGFNIYTKGESQMESITAVISDGSIKSVGAFDSSVLNTTEEEELSVDDDKIPTSGAVRAAIDKSVPTWEQILTL